jgi:hypothetical protein
MILALEGLMIELQKLLEDSTIELKKFWSGLASD